MIYTIDKLAKIVGCSNSTMQAYISRAEFSHIKVFRVDNSRTRLYKGLYKADIDRLKELINNGKRKTRYKNG